MSTKSAESPGIEIRSDIDINVIVIVIVTNAISSHLNRSLAQV